MDAKKHRSHPFVPAAPVNALPDACILEDGDSLLIYALYDG